MRYISTRDNYISYDFTDILMRGLAPDGGLFLPQDWPSLSKDEWLSLRGHSYADVAFAIMRCYTGGSISDLDLKTAIDKTYADTAPDSADKFRNPDITPLHHFEDQKYIMELFHGPTLAFKDVALQFLGQLFDLALEKENKKITIIGATSGDTGSAAIEGCKNCKNARIFILHPHGRTSDVQRRQMTTVLSDNVHNIALEGTFDDCQNIVKELFADKALNSTHNFTAINSINWARIMAQIVYYAYAALKLDCFDKGIQFVVPTGNFGNIFAAYAAKQMGVPIKKLVIASNENDILTRFTHTGVMEGTGVHKTLSPSMDIQISSNFERYLFELLGRKEDILVSFMERFKKEGTAQITNNERQIMNQLFAAYRVDDEETISAIKKAYASHDYILDPHSAVGYAAMLDALEDENLREDIPCVTLACAHPSKFPDAVHNAIGITPELPSALSDLYAREERYSVLPNDYAAIVDFINSA